ncbi:MAG: thioredoxin domain-containing protein [Planctomycetes bacterium]|nr:thioredoxin domain-containing protein [Planctomycetota bacterium]
MDLRLLPFIVFLFWAATRHALAAEAQEQQGRANRLLREKSAYLRQHAYNPVDWHPWGEEAFARAHEEDKPVFLSIGYSTCHWCHVMERESFENEEIAAYLNEHFVSIKVDREERPDVDAIYMAYVTARTGSGGWPMSVFLTPERVPFFGGTYFPPDDGLGRPGFKRLLEALKGAWDSDRERIVRSGEDVTRYLEARGALLLGRGDIEPDLIEDAVERCRQGFDHAHGGEAGAPKFPAPMTLALLLRHEYRTGDDTALEMVVKTLDAMARGGIHDQLGGGFARYSVDAQWLVPHFEKMLYGNALLARIYCEAYQRTGAERFAAVVRGILDYLLRDMRLAGGAFAAAEDADSEGAEGLFYTWTPDEIRAVLGADLAQEAIAAFGVTEEGHVDGRSVLHLTDAADAGAGRLAEAKRRLLAARARRARPLRDDKVVTAWNGLAISAFAFCGRALDEARYVVAAEEAAAFLLDRLQEDGRLLRRYSEGEARFPGGLEDHAHLVQGLLDLYEADFDLRWLEEAERLSECMLALFSDEESGTFFDAEAGAADLLVRPRDATDGATPSGTAVAVKNLLRLSHLLASAELRKRAGRCLEAYGASLRNSPLAFPELLTAAAMYLEPPREAVFAGTRGAADLEALVAAYYREFRPFRVLALAEAGAAARPPDALVLELIEGKTPVRGQAAVYLCQDYTCFSPVTDPAELLGSD